MRNVILLLLFFSSFAWVKAQSNCTAFTTIPSLPYASGALTTCGSVNDFAAGSYCNTSYGAGEDYVFQYTATVTGAHPIALGGASTWKIASVHTACPPTTANCVGSITTSSGSTASGTVPLTAGTTYYIVVDHWPTPTCGAFTLTLDLPIPPPSNDDCTGAIAAPAIPLDGTCATLTNQSTAGATQSQAACVGSGADDDVWFSFVATSTSVIVDLTAVSGSSDRVHQIFSGSCGSLTSIKCSDPETSTTTGLTVGSTYYLRVHTYATANNSVFNLCLKVPPPPPANDNCTGAIAAPAIPLDGTCATLTNQSTAGATQSQAACVGSGADDDVWFSFVATSTSVIVDLIAVSGSSDRVHQIFSGSCGSLTSVTCSDPETSTTTGLTVGNTYYLRVHTYSTGTNSVFNLCLKVPPPPPPNDLCSNAVLLANSASGTAIGTTVGAGTEVPNQICAGVTITTGDVWYKIITDNDGINGEILTVTLTPSASQDYAIYLYSGTCAALTYVTCADATLSGGVETISYTVPNGFDDHNGGSSRNNIEFFVRVKQFGTASGTFTLVANGTALPISLAKINAKASGSNNVITWTTASEINNEVQIVERSINGKSDWLAIGQVKGTNKNHNVSYEIADLEPTAIAYYRIHSVDFDGKEQYSKLVSVFRGSEISRVSSIKPNPTSNFIEVDLQVKSDGNVTYNIMDLTGKIIKTMQYNVEYQSSNSHKLDLSDLPKGLYLLSIDGAGFNHRAKIIKD